MNATYTIIAVAAMMVVMFVFMGIWASRYVKVPPNQVLIVSGRRIQLPDGTFAGFLSKNQTEIKNIVWPVLEKHLSSVLGSSSLEEATQNPAACAARVQTVASADLARMGLSMISFTIRNAHAV